MYLQKLFALYPVFCCFFIPSISTYCNGKEASKLSKFFSETFYCIIFIGRKICISNEMTTCSAVQNVAFIECSCSTNKNGNCKSCYLKLLLCRFMEFFPAFFQFLWKLSELWVLFSRVQSSWSNSVSKFLFIYLNYHNIYSVSIPGALQLTEVFVVRMTTDASKRN